MSGNRARFDGKFGIIPEEVIYDNELSPTAFRVYCALARHGMDPESCFPSHARVAGLLGVSAKTIERAVRDLADRGWITVEVRTREDGSQTTNGYVIHISRVERSAAGPDTSAAPPTGMSGEPPTDLSGVGPTDLSGLEGEPPKETKEEEPRRRSRSRRSATANPAPPEAQDALIPEPQDTPGTAVEVTRIPTARDLVAGWVDGYKHAHRTAPNAALVKRVAGTAKQLGAGLPADRDAWVEAWRHCKALGAEGVWDVVGRLPRAHTPAAKDQRSAAHYLAHAGEYRAAREAREAATTDDRTADAILSVLAIGAA